MHTRLIQKEWKLLSGDTATGAVQVWARAQPDRDKIAIIH